MSGRIAGRVGRAHGLDGSFYVDSPAAELLARGSVLDVGGRLATVVRRAGTDARPIVRLDGVEGRAAADALRGRALAAASDAGGSPAPAAEEWDRDELVGCSVEGVGVVRAVIAAPSCDVLEVVPESAAKSVAETRTESMPAPILVPLVRDAVRRVDVDARVVEVDRRFLGLE